MGNTKKERKIRNIRKEGMKKREGLREERREGGRKEERKRREEERRKGRKKKGRQLNAKSAL